MSKININFNNKVYNVDEASFSDVAADLKSHLSTKMNGSGAIIDFGGQSYNVDSTKLQNATNEFVAHLGTIVGTGKKVFVNGVEYGLDSNKLTGAVSELEIVLGNLHSDDGGSGDVTFEPEKNEYGFYFNVPYMRHIENGEYSYDEAIVFYEDGTMIISYNDPSYNAAIFFSDNVLYVEYSYLTVTFDYGDSISFSEDGKRVMGYYDDECIATGVEHSLYFNEVYTNSDGQSIIAYPYGYLPISDDLSDGNMQGWQFKGHYGYNYFNEFRISMDGTVIVGGWKNIEPKTYHLNKSTPALTSPNISIVNDILNITQVKNADAYEVYREDELLVTTSALTVDLTQYITEKNTYILVRAISDDYVSSEFTLAQYGADFIYGLYKEGAIDLYETEGAEAIKDMLIKSWGELIINRYVNKVDSTIENGGFMSGDLIVQNGITEITDFAFRYDEYLTGLILPNSVTSFGSAFESCNRLKKVIIPNSVTYGCDFSYCQNLTSIKFMGTVEEWNAITKESYWNKYIEIEVVCSDGTVTL